MNTDNKTPLWKELNEKRTSGEWYMHDQYLRSGDKRINYIHAHTDFSREIDELNASYTCLAVNNLHHLAEALEKIAGLYNRIYPLIDDGAINEFTDMEYIFQNAKAALSRIS